MNKTEKKTVKKYLSKVTSALTGCSWSLKKVFEAELKTQIKEHFESREITYEALISAFGTPEEIAAGFYDRQEHEELLKKAKKLNKVLLVLSVVLVIVIVFLLFLVFHLYDKIGGTITISGAGSGTYKIN